MDSFSAGLLLQAFSSAKGQQEVNRLVDFSKGLNGKGISDEVKVKVEAMKDKPCTIKGTSHVGTVVGPNMSSGGFYPGSVYPVLVKVQDGTVFEYDLDQVLLTV